MIVTPGDGVAVLISSIVWFASSLVIGFVGARWPLDRLERAGPVTRLRGWEDDGRWWHRHLRVHRWRDRMPEAGGLFPGGFSKRHLPSRRTEDLDRFRLEALRAERVHWSMMATTPLHAVWCRPAIFAGMVAFGVVANLPCIVIQRANRGRLGRLLDRRAKRTAR